jgi:hypothetical protein
MQRLDSGVWFPAFAGMTTHAQIKAGRESG